MDHFWITRPSWLIGAQSSPRRYMLKASFGSMVIRLLEICT